MKKHDAKLGEESGSTAASGEGLFPDAAGAKCTTAAFWTVGAQTTNVVITDATKKKDFDNLKYTGAIAKITATALKDTAGNDLTGASAKNTAAALAVGAAAGLVAAAIA